MTGTSDAILHVLARDMRHLEEALERIRASADIERSESIVVLSNIIETDPSLTSSSGRGDVTTTSAHRVQKPT